MYEENVRLTSSSVASRVTSVVQVDMEAFLTLDEDNLVELGVAQHEPRRQILAAITELKSRKGREKQEYEESQTQQTQHFRYTFTSLPVVVTS